MTDELEQILRNYGYQISGRCRGSSSRCWLIGGKRGKARDSGDKECQAFAALSKQGSEVSERHFVFSVSRSALASQWVKEQIADPDRFLFEAGLAHFCALLMGNDETGDDYPELMLHSRSTRVLFEIPGRTDLPAEVGRVKREILSALRIAAYEGRGRVSKSEVATLVCARDIVLDRALLFLEEQGQIKGARLGEIKITTLGEAELDKMDKDSSTERREQASPAIFNSRFDLFVSHASEDKQGFVRPLADRLVAEGITVWYDDFALKLGDSLRESIDRGLRESKHGLVVLSHAFFSKDWPQRELDGLFALAKRGERRVLPIWHEVTAEELKRFSPMLADLKAVRSSDGMDLVVSALLEVVRPTR